MAGEDHDDDEQIPLCRIEDLGDDKDRGFAIYDPATGDLHPGPARTGQPTGHPSDAFGAAALVHLADLAAVNIIHTATGKELTRSTNGTKTSSRPRAPGMAAPLRAILSRRPRRATTTA